MATGSTPDLFDVSGKRVLVTGASRGIGQVLAVGFAQRGAQVLAVARSAEGLAETTAMASGMPGSVATYAADLSVPEAIDEVIAQVSARLGGLDVLVNNAAADTDAKIEDTSLDDWDRIIDLNLRSCWMLCRAASALLQDGGGKVINVASMLGMVAVRENSVYITSKHGLIGTTRALALEWARKGIQVNALAPGFIRTDMLASALADEATAKYLKSRTPMGRVAEPEELLGTVIYLSSAASDYVTGQVLVVDGGYTAQ